MTADWTLEESTHGAATRLRLAGRPRSLGGWVRSCRELTAAWPVSGRVELELEGSGAGASCEADRPVAEVLAASEALMRRRRSRRLPLLVEAAGALSGPWLALALSAELLVVREGMAAEALVCEDSRLLTPAELLGVAGRLGRARALEWALAGTPFGAAELLEHHAALTGEDGRRAWAAARAGSLVAQGAAAALLRAREPGRAASEALERALFAACFAREDRKEGVAAFRERREPEFPSAGDDRESRGSE